jgi:peptidoglycan hydrolase-like protein with peptidoglycan-binding domain
MKTIRVIAFACLAIGVAVFSVSTTFADLGGITPPPVVAPPEPTPVPTPTPVVVVAPPADTTPPVISGIASASVSDVAATVVWITDEAATSTFQYGTTTGYGSSATLPSGALLAHTAVLTGLAASTTYHYCISATDLYGNTSSSCGQSFATAAATDTTPPAVSAIVATSVSSTSETVTWTTGEAADGQVEYGTSESYGSATTLNSSLALTHSQTLSNLTPSTIYHYRVVSKDAAGNVTTSGDQTFTTGAAPSVVVADTTPPTISSVSNSELSSSTAAIVWTTNELATSTLEYGTTTAYGTQAQLAPDALLAHSAGLVNLSPSTTYYYCIHATDLSGNVASSCGHQFSTEAATAAPQTSGDTTPPIISGVAETSVTDNAAVLVWTTDELATSTLTYGLTTGYGSTATFDGSALLAHIATLSGLTSNTTYYYCITATDVAMNTASSCGQSFTTAHVSSDIAPPMLTAVATAPVSPTSEAVTWTTNELADSQVEYGASESYGSTTTLDATRTLSHSQMLSGLTPSMLYHYRVLSKDSSSNLTTSRDYTFTTSSAPVVNVPDTTPPVISGIADTSVTDAAATVVWTTSELATSTFEYGTTTSYGSSAALPTGALLAHTAVLTGLAPNTIYHYCIMATDLAGNLASDCGQSFTTARAAGDTVPPVVSAVATASVSPTSENVTWATGELADGQVEYGTTEGYGTSSSLDSTLNVSHTQTLAGLAPSTTYHYRVLSKDATGNLTTSPDYTFTTESLPIVNTPVVNPPADTTPPVISGVANSEISTNTATLIWETNELASSTLQYGTTTSYGSSATVGVTAALAHTAVLTGLAPSTTYHYCISATDLSGNLTNSCGHQFSTESAGTPQQNLTDITAPLITSTSTGTPSSMSASVSWTTDEAATSRVQYGTTTGYGLETALDGNLVTSHAVSLTNLSLGTEYHYQIITADSAGNTTVSGDGTFTTPANPTSGSPNQGSTPAAPIVVSSAQSSGSPESATITWVTDQATDSQVVYGTTASYGSSSTLNSTLSTTHAVTLTNLTPSTTYHYEIKSKNAGGTYAITSDETFTTLAAPLPAAAISSVAATTTENSVAVTWTTDIPADSHVEYGLNTAYDSQTTESTNLVTSHSQTIANLAPGTTYDFRVLSQSAGADEAISTNYTFTTSATTESSSGNGTNPSESQPAPSAVTSVWTSDVEQTAVTVNFSTPNTPENEALQYDIRYSTSPITENNFSSATPASDTPIYFDFPEAGTTANNQYIVLGLQPGTRYYFAVQAKSQAGGTSPISEVASATTAAHVTSSTGGAAAASGNAGGASSGTGGSYTTGGVNPPQNIRAAAADSSAVLFWDNPPDSSFVRVKVVRSATAYPASINDGQVVYEGSQSGFTDTSLTNGATYYYSIFSLSHLSHVSAPLQFSVTPQAGTEQVNLLQHQPVTVCVGQDLSFGMRSSAVTQLQQYLDSLEPITYPDNLITGYFYTYTRAAVKQLQGQYGLPQTGVWDATTQAAVGVCFGTVAATPVAPTSTLTRDLQVGSSGADVTLLQQFLIGKGLLGSQYATGYFGQLTKAAVIKYQQNNGILPASGYVGAATKSSISSNP